MLAVMLGKRTSVTLQVLLGYVVDMGQFDPTKGKQALEIRSSLSERRSLTDPILPGESTDVVQAHSLLWAKAHGKLLTKETVIKSYCKRDVLSHGGNAGKKKKS